jgi:hypothetical protein
MSADERQRHPTMPFGKHRGQPLSALPAHYLGWLSRLPDLAEPLASQVTAELQRRLEAARQRAAIRQQQTRRAARIDPRQGTLFTMEHTP